jgi:hypothetical protein
VQRLCRLPLVNSDSHGGGKLRRFTQIAFNQGKNPTVHYQFVKFSGLTYDAIGSVDLIPLKLVLPQSRLSIDFIKCWAHSFEGVCI